ncbi:MAG TPA: endonuclease III, partial [Actinomycetota bacterium]|nr:endonuclease III [Actinomycetota bacterium]
DLGHKGSSPYRPNERSFGNSSRYRAAVAVDRFAPGPERIRPILKHLAKTYPEARIALDYQTPLECVVAVILSAQSTDARVNIVTKDLFQKYRRPEDYLAVEEEELQRDIQSTGFFRQKTRALRGMCQKLIDDFDGEVPKTIAELITLPGVARKTANVVQLNLFPEVAAKDPDAGIAVDTHVGRVAVRLALTEWDSKEAVKIEQDLMNVVPKKERLRVTDLFIEHGRQICDAKQPRCEDCPIESLCPSSQVAGLPDLYRKAPKSAPVRKKAKTAR